MFERLLLNSAWPSNRPALVAAGTTATWGDLGRKVESLGLDEPALAHRRVGLVFRPNPACLAALAVLDRLACDTVLIDGGLRRDEAIRLGRELGFGAVLIAPGHRPGAAFEQLAMADEQPGTGRSTVTLMTSGTTGTPKAARHTWESLIRPVRIAADQAGPRWLLTYRPHLYAGLQVLLQCMVNGGTLVVPEQDDAPAATVELMIAAQVGHVSATPSYWRRLLLFADRARLCAAPLVQLTLGGEVVDQPIIDALRQTFPAARIVHIYATTELGRCFAVTDGQAGFPAHYLHEPTPDGVELRLEDDELVVRPVNAMEVAATPPPGTWGHRTGDLVEVIGDRAYFVGRRTDMINVGGVKVHPIEVERVLRGVPGVADARAFGKRSSIVGEVVACQVVPAAGADVAALRETIMASSLAGLSPFQRPRLVDFVSEIALEDSGKMNRRPAP